MTILKICNKIIEYSFYALFLLVPLVIASDTSELFEFNKMWLTFGFSLVIAASWITKMIIQKRIWVQRTPLDIPILLFFLSQFIATIFSWDMHISIWGYYSRFNGGLLSILTYIFLYYAFVSNLYNLRIVKRLLLISLLSGLVVSLWGLPSHFGYDPTCFLFRQTFDVSCWTEDFQPKIRIFSTLGQPDWLAAYLAILLPISIIIFIISIKNLPLSIFHLLLSALFYLDILYTRARSGILAVWISLTFLFATYLWVYREKLQITNYKLLIIILTLGLITFFIGQPFPQLDKFTFDGLRKTLLAPKVKPPSSIPQSQTPHLGELGGTDSSKIRAVVWKGAINTWRHHPIFGTGVETFAFAYYRYKDASQNLTSEWNFLYNKAHNEYLNYLATTGIFGLGTYLLMIGWFLFRSLSIVMLNSFQHLNQTGSRNKFGMTADHTLILALLASYISILITNFFGFSVVITNIYLFMIPSFVFVLSGMIDKEKQNHQSPLSNHKSPISYYQWTFIVILLFAICYLLFSLLKFWLADKNYSLGYTLSRAGEYQQASLYLRKAVHLRNEPVFKDELAVNDAMLAVELLSQKNSDENKEALKKANNLVQEAIETSDQLTSSHEDNVVFWKTRTRIFYNLSRIDSQYLPFSLSAIEKAANLAPTDASISYNLGVLYGQNNDIKKAIAVLENTIKLKPDYQDAHYALGLFYREEAIDKNGKVINASMQEKAIEQMQYIIDNFPSSSSAKDAIKSWEKK